MVDILGPSWAAWVDLIRNIALIGIAPSLFLVRWLIDKSSATHVLLQRITTPPIIDIFERLRLYNKFRGKKAQYDPYAPNDQDQPPHDLLFDIVMVLNFYEGICVEIDARKVWRRRVYRTAASLLIGVRNNQLVWYNELAPDTNLHEAYPKIYAVSEASARWAARHRVKIFETIGAPGK